MLHVYSFPMLKGLALLGAKASLKRHGIQFFPEMAFWSKRVKGKPTQDFIESSRSIQMGLPFLNVCLFPAMILHTGPQLQISLASQDACTNDIQKHMSAQFVKRQLYPLHSHRQFPSLAQRRISTIQDHMLLCFDLFGGELTG